MGSGIMSTLGLVDEGSLLFTGDSLSVITFSLSSVKPDIFVDSSTMLTVGCLCDSSIPTPQFLRVKNSNFVGSNGNLLLQHKDTSTR